MVKVISKEAIDSIDRNRTIQSKLETKQINEAVNPKPAAKKKGFSFPKQQKPPPRPPAHLIKMINRKMNAEGFGSPQYSEYKESIDKIINGVIASGETTEDNRRSLRDRVAQSKDIKSIVKNRILSSLDVQNEFLVLLLTVGTLYLENRVTPPPL